MRSRQTVLIVEASEKRADDYYRNIARTHAKPGPHRINAKTPEVGLSLISPIFTQPDIIVYCGRQMTFSEGKKLLEEEVAKNTAPRERSQKKK